MRRLMLFVFLLVSVGIVFPSTGQAMDIVYEPLETYPDEIQARLEQFEREALALPRSDEEDIVHAQAVIDLLRRWNPGQTITVAFKGASPDVHKKIEEIANEWTKHANLKLDFGYSLQTGTYRTWSSADQDYRADIRISFDAKGYWSLVGTTSRNPAVAGPSDASMNFAGFDKGMPNLWQSTVLHEFGHAISAKHEHQHPLQGCDAEWRWEDDTGYEATKNSEGQFITDTKGRRLGIYTVLSGPPNNWPKHKVDHNLKQLGNSSAYDFGEFDKRSIMKYYFGEWMFKHGSKSHCFTGSKNTALSEEDRKRIAKNYPFDPQAIADLLEQSRRILRQAEARSTSLPQVQRALQSRLSNLN